MAGTITITGSSTDQAGSRTLPTFSIAGTTAIGETYTSSLATGDTTIAVPAGAVGALIIPPTGATATLKLRTNVNAADVGLQISNTQPTLYTFPSPSPTSLVINASANLSALLDVWFW